MFTTKVKYVYLSLVASLIGVQIFAFTNCSRMEFASTLPLLEKNGDPNANDNRAIIINNDAPFTNKKEVLLTLRSGSAKEMYVTNDPTCENGGEWEPYKESRPWVMEQSNQDVAIYVRYRENANSDNKECHNDSIVHDDIPPQITILRAAPSLTKERSLSLQIQTSDNLTGVAQLRCLDKNNEPLVASCRETLQLKDLSEGPGAITFFAIDKAGNTSEPLNQSWLVDFTPPEITLNKAPAKISNSAKPTFLLTAIDTYSQKIQFTCALDQEVPQPCDALWEPTVTGGPHQVSFAARDEAGNESLPLKYDWIVDLKAPSVEITKTPVPLTNLQNATFEFRGFDEGVPLTKYECRVGERSIVPCTSPLNLTQLSEATHRFQVVGIDEAGNRSSPAEYAWVVDRTPPKLTLISGPPALTNLTTASLTYKAEDSSGIISTECLFDGQLKENPCAFTKTYKDLKEGSHSVRISAVDGAGNAATPLVIPWKVDLTPPTVKIVSAPDQLTQQISASFSLQATDNEPGAVALECHINNEPYTNCSNPASFVPLKDGTHTFYVRGKDQAGNLSTEVTYTWVIDATGPVIHFTKSPLATIGQSQEAIVAFTVSDTPAGIDSVLCGLKDKEVECTSAKQESFTNLPAEQNYTYSVIAKDRLGNISQKTVTWNVTTDTRDVQQAVPVTGYNMSDILIVIDNSGSMSEEQTNMALRFGSLFDVIKKLDWRLGIITTDLDYSQLFNAYPDSYTLKRDGRLLEFFGLTGTYFLNAQMDPAVVNTAFSKTIQRPSYEGSGAEQGIGATYRAIQRSQEETRASSAPNRAFFRAGASLSVVIVSDADETPSYPNTVINTPSEVVKLAQATWPGKPFIVHSIVVRSQDTNCLFKAGSGNEEYGDTYEALSALTGGLVGDVCATDYANQLKAIGQKVVESVNSLTLSCLPVDLDKDGTPEIRVELADGTPAPAFTVNQFTLNFTQALPEGNHTIRYRCLK